MIQGEFFDGGSGRVCLFQNCIYGLSRVNATFDSPISWNPSDSKSAERNDACWLKMKRLWFHLCWLNPVYVRSELRKIWRSDEVSIIRSKNLESPDIYLVSCRVCEEWDLKLEKIVSTCFSTSSSCVYQKYWASIVWKLEEKTWSDAIKGNTTKMYQNVFNLSIRTCIIYITQVVYIVLHTSSLQSCNRPNLRRRKVYPFTVKHNPTW
jgi:hypothetical protein